MKLLDVKARIIERLGGEFSPPHAHYTNQPKEDACTQKK